MPLLIVQLYLPDGAHMYSSTKSTKSNKEMLKSLLTEAIHSIKSKNYYFIFIMLAINFHGLELIAAKM